LCPTTLSNRERSKNREKEASWSGNGGCHDVRMRRFVSRKLAKGAKPKAKIETRKSYLLGADISETDSMALLQPRWKSTRILPVRKGYRTGKGNELERNP